MTQMDAENTPESVQETDTPVEAIDITETQDGGIMKEIIVPGEGEDSPCKNDKVWVHYIGAFEDGQIFDSSRMRDEQFEFELGKEKVIKAWDIGVATMKRGEKCKLTCKPEYAYGKKGSPPKIPPDSTLVFEIELFDWKGEDLSEDKDGGILRSTLRKGEGFKTPNEGARVKVHYIGKYSGQVFEDREVEFTVGEGCEDAIIEGLDKAIHKFKQNEKSRLIIDPKYAYGSKGKPELNIPPEATLHYEMELKSFEKAKESWEMDTKEKLEQSDIIKAKGTKFFKDQNYKMAVAQYKRIIKYLEYEDKLGDDEQKQRDALMLAAHLNLAMSHLKMGDYHEVEKECEKALEADPKNEKAYFRRGQARLSKNDFDMAKEDFQKVIEIDPENKAAKNQVVVCNQKIKQFKEREKRIYAGMFSKFSEKDAKIESENKAKSKEQDQNKNASDEQSGGSNKPATPDSDSTSDEITPNGEASVEPDAESSSSQGPAEITEPMETS